MTWHDWMQRLPGVFRDSRSLRRRAAAKRGFCRVEALETRNLLTINFQFDYSLDTSHFFDSSGARAALEQAAQSLESYLSDSLDAITPSGANSWIAQFTSPSSGATVSVGNLSIAANTLLIFVGARDFSGGTVAESAPGGWIPGNADPQWLNLLAGRGQVGAVPVSGSSAPATDFGPWGGALSFDSVGTDWYFGSSANGIGSTQMDFVSVAQHELAHILGFGTAESFDRYISGSTFTGPSATAAYDGVGSPPLSGDRAHWQGGTTDGGQAAAMDPALGTGTRRLFTSLDYAALNDIGWNSNTGGGGTGGGQGSVIITAGSNLQTTESGGAVSFTAVLNSRPTSMVTLRLTNTNLNEAFLSTSTLVFTSQNWNVPQTVVVTGVDDLVIDGNQTFQILTSPLISSDSRFNGVNPIDLTITNIDNDHAGITVTPTSGLVTTEQGGTSSFYVSLSSKPFSNVTIGVSSSNTKEGTVSLSTLVFTPTNWMNAQIVTVTGVNDYVSDSDKMYTIILGTAVSSDLSYSGINPPDVSVMNTSIPDVTPTITLSSSAVTVRPEGNPILLDSNAMVYDLDSPFLNMNGARLVVTLTQNGTSNDRLVILNEGKSKGQVGVPSSGSSITYAGVTIGTRSGGTGTTPLVITFNTKATMAIVQEVVRNLQFRTTTSNKSNLDRCVSLQLRTSDGQTSSVASKVVHVMTGALPPVINVGASSLSYVNKSGPQLINPTASLVDPDSALFGGGKLTISLGSGAAAGDALRIRRQGRGAAQIDAANDGTVRFGSVIIGSWSGGTNGKPLVITLKSTASLSAVQALIRNITFETASNNTSLASRAVNFQVTDGRGGSSATVTKSITVQ
jgi:hypothetical protein